MNTNCKSTHEGRTAGFTLTELLVVIGVIGVLAVMLLPALASSRSDGRAFRCLNNTKQLTLGWIMYANDNNEMLMPPSTWITSGSFLDWSTNPINTDTGYMLADALMAPYVKSPATYKCPADVFDGPAGPRVRSYSLDGALGGSPVFGNQYPFAKPRTYFSARKTTDLNTPGPASIFTFLDEHPDSISDGLFMLNAGAYSGQGTGVLAGFSRQFS